MTLIEIVAIILPALGLILCWFLIGIFCIEGRLLELLQYHRDSHGWGGPSRLTDDEYREKATHCFYGRSYLKLFLIGGPGLLICRLFFSKTFFPKPQD